MMSVNISIEHPFTLRWRYGCRLASQGLETGFLTDMQSIVQPRFLANKSIEPTRFNC